MKKLLSLFLISALIVTCFAACSSKRDRVIISSDSSFGSENIDKDKSGTTEAPINAIDPFKNLAVDFDGVSPYCTVSFNNSKCSEAVQTNVVYSLESDKIVTDKTYKIGDTVTVYASLRNSYNSEEQYAIYPTSKEYKVENVPEYLTDLTAETDLTKFKTELVDNIAAFTAWSPDNRPFDTWGAGYQSHDSLTQNDVYFSALKINAYPKFNERNVDSFNRIDIIYSVKINHNNDNSETYYFTLQFKNVVKYPDGSIGWGENDPASLDFQYAWKKNQNDLINENLISKKADFNVTKVTELFK